jgi:hypothetical protein
MTPEFNDWWNSDLLSTNNPYREDAPAYWAWEGWQAGVKAERRECVIACEGVEQATESQSWVVANCVADILARDKI